MKRATFRLAAGTGFDLDDLRIVARTRFWSEPEAAPRLRVIFVRRGCFQVRAPGWRDVVDPVTAYLRGPGDEGRIAHRPDTEDACTVLSLDRTLATEALGEWSPTGPLLTSGRTDLAHRVLVARARHGADAFELAERVVLLLAELRRRGGTAAPGPVSPSHRRLVESARELLAADPGWGSLDGLATALGVSRSHLSRVFRAGTGESLTRFRARLRVRAALDRIEAGESSLTRLAADLGFADHAHLTRTVRAQLGTPPSRLRRVLEGPAGQV